jgi:hypothetical protein
LALPSPEPGLVIRYDYLWSREAITGLEQGKDRPTCIIAATDGRRQPRYVVLLPLTHTPPSGDTIGVEIPARVKRAIGLDDEPSWVIVSEHNIDIWPNSGLSSIPGKAGVYSYGLIPPGLFASIKAEFMKLAQAKQSKPVQR